MSSILTNSSAMVALQTLKMVNKNLAHTQGMISTGKDIASAKDNSAIWSISKVMESDVKGFKAISDSLSLGQSTIAVGRQATETITDLLTDIKGKIVAAQEDNVDRTKINDDVTALRDQIASVVSAAQFNGLNLVDGTTPTATILASLDRDNTGAVTASSITVNGQDMSTGGYVANDVFGSSTGASAAGDTLAQTLDAAGGTSTIVIDDTAGAAFVAGDSVSVTVGGQTVSYTVTAGDVGGGNVTADLVAVGLKGKIDALGIAGLTVDYDGSATGELAFTNAGAVDLSVSAQFTNAGSGGLAALSSIDVSTSAAATTSLGTIETLIDTAIDAAAAFGSVEGRVEIQSEFISNLTDSLTTGIGALVDANMEEASARLQALQVQQQLATQSLSIANQAPQAILQLFRG
ncbi:flagellin [Roseovarius aestuarii]|uniref:Flagellin n=1 Tax=Roseovarius aestuarii TaxID=475083 RepID=A0A1X7BQI2_9RHOB|nr:flagellin [Roseovarius aestuarii]SMC11877.1 Flagellin [Roseovarius aestuarii]